MEDGKKITKRIGSFTFGIMMILMGISIFLQTITSLELLKFTLSLWPIIFVLLGIETLYYSYKKDVEVKYDMLGILTMFVVLFIGMIFSTINYGVNKVLYNKEIKSDIIYCLTDLDRNISFENKVNINNMSNKNVTVKFVENKEANDVNTRILFDYDESYEGGVLKIFKERDLMNSSLYINNSNQQININSMPDFVKSVQIIVTASDKSKIEYNGIIEK